MATAASSAWTARSPGSSRNETPPRQSARFEKSTAASTRSTWRHLFEALAGIASQNAQGEYYLTDLIAIYRRRKLLVKSVLVDDPQEVRGVNSRTELAEVSRLVRQKKNEELMASGVTLVDPAATYIDPDVEIGADTVIHPGVIIEGRTRIGAACEIHAHVTIADTEIGDNVTIKSFSLMTGSPHRGRGVGRSVRAPSPGDSSSARARRSATSSS